MTKKELKIIQTKIISITTGNILKTTYLIKNSIPLVPLSINRPNAPVFLLKWKSIDKEWRCLKTIKAISLVADWDTKEKRESLISPKANDEIFANPWDY